VAVLQSTVDICHHRASLFRDGWPRLPSRRVCLDDLRPDPAGTLRAHFRDSMRLAWLAAIAAVALTVGGCSTAPFVGYRNGPVTLYIGDVHHVCAAGGNSNRGCTMHYPNGHVEVYCAEGDYECLAHELHHVVDPTWEHDLDYRNVSAR
jgi:hypothetical protein